VGLENTTNVERGTPLLSTKFVGGFPKPQFDPIVAAGNITMWPAWNMENEDGVVRNGKKQLTLSSVFIVRSLRLFRHCWVILVRRRFVSGYRSIEQNYLHAEIYSSTSQVKQNEARL